MSYKINKEDVGHENDQHLNIKDDLDFSIKDIFALTIAAFQIVLPFVFVLVASLAVFMLILQVIF